MPNSPGLFVLAVLFGIVAALLAAFALKVAYFEHSRRHARPGGFEVKEKPTTAGEPAGRAETKADGHHG